MKPPARRRRLKRCLSNFIWCSSDARVNGKKKQKCPFIKSPARCPQNIGGALSVCSFPSGQIGGEGSLLNQPCFRSLTVSLGKKAAAFVVVKPQRRLEAESIEIVRQLPWFHCLSSRHPRRA